jgi:AcrR family transcriptional regulator
MARTRAVDFDEKRRAILDSAAAVFATRGMEHASMAQIASENNVSKALLYHYYPSKDLLIFDIGRTHLIELEAAIQAADRPTLPPAERLKLLIAAVLENYRNADSYQQVLLNGTGSLSTEQRAELQQIERRIVHWFSGILRAINPEIERNRPLLTPITMSLFGMLNWLYTWFRPNGPISREEYAELVTQLLLGGVKSIG